MEVWPRLILIENFNFLADRHLLGLLRRNPQKGFNRFLMLLRCSAQCFGCTTDWLIRTHPFSSPSTGLVVL